MGAWGDPRFEALASEHPRSRADTVLEFVLSVVVLAALVVGIGWAVMHTTAMSR